jgi:DNA-binding IclR family transcriptional regulator
MIRNCGYCIGQQGFGDGVTGIAVPLFNGKGDVIAALAVLGPVFRMALARLDAELLPSLREAAAVISAGLGYLGDYHRQNSVS